MIEPRDLFRVWIVEPRRPFERIRAQSGAFLLSAFHERFERSAIRSWNRSIPVYEHWTLNVPAKRKGRILASRAKRFSQAWTRPRRPSRRGVPSGGLSTWPAFSGARTAFWKRSPSLA